MERRAATVLGALILVIALGVLAAFLFLRNGDDGDSALAAFSAKERPTELALPERLSPFGAGLTGEAFLIAEHNGLRFVRLARDDGSSCWATADRRFGDWGLTEYVCEVGTRRFPDPELPVLVAARQTGIGNRLVDYQAFAGFAADPIKRIAYIDENDRLVPAADVVGNVFSSAKPPTAVKRIVALDEHGEIIWRGAEVPLPEE